jgi:hypothetical protein
MADNESINLFKPGTSVNAVMLYGAMLKRHFADSEPEDPFAETSMKTRREMDGLNRIMNQYSTMEDLAADMVPNMIDGYLGMFPKENRFLTACQRLNKLIIEDEPPRGYAYDFRAVRLSLYESRKYPGKLMLGAYILFHKSSTSGQPLAPGDYILKYGADDYAMPMFALCVTMTNLIDLLDGLGRSHIDTDICVKAI